MASISIHLLSIFIFFQIPLSFSETLILPVTKDNPTNQYLTQINHGTQPTPKNLLLDLTGSYLWLDCGYSNPNPVHCRSIQCSSAMGHPCGPPNSAALPPCTLVLENPVTGATINGELVEDTVEITQFTTVDRFLFSCAPSILLTGLPSGAQGVLGLGRARTGALTQVSHSFGYPQKFFLCLSSSNGMILSGKEEIINLGQISKSLIYTPLLMGKGDYHINLKDIKIQNKKLPLEELTLTSVKISTVVPYTTLDSRIYQVFVKTFTMEAESLNMSRVPQVVDPFGVCYYRASNETGGVPVIDLVLQSEMVKWRIYGHNSMVKVNKDVMCLGFLDGGMNLGASIVLGGYQLEDNLLEFDLGSSMLGFSSSFIRKQMSCSQLSLLAMHKDHQSL